MENSLINSHSNHDMNYNYHNTQHYCSLSGAELTCCLSSGLMNQLCVSGQVF